MADDDFALVSAALRRDVPGMQAALRAGADPLQAAPGGLTALHAAAMWGLAEAVPLLVSAGAGVDARMASTVEVAAFMQSRGFTLPGKYTLRFVDDDATPLHLAASEGSAATVRALLAAGASRCWQRVPSSMPCWEPWPLDALHPAAWASPQPIS